MIEVARNREPHALKAAISNLINALDREEISDDDRNKLVHTSVTLYAAAQFWADNVMSVKFDAYDKQGERIHEEDPQRGAIYLPLRRRMWYNLERMEWTRMFWEGILLHKKRGAGNRVTELAWINPNIYEPDITTWDGLKGFRIRRRGTKYDQEPDLRYVRLQDAVYLNGIDFEDDYGGVAPAEVAYLVAGLEVEIAQTWLAIFRNRMMPFGVVQPADKGEAWDQRVMDIIKTSLRVITQGSRNAGKTIVSPGRAEWIQLGQKLDGVPVSEFDEKVDHAMELATGVYRSLISPEDSSFAQAEVARRTWGHARLVPHLNKLGHVLTEGLAPEFPGVAEIKPRTDEITFLKEDETSKVNYVNTRVQGVTLDLYRAQVELKDDDPNEALKDFYLVQGVPVHVSKFPALADKLLLGTAEPEAMFGGDGPQTLPPQLNDQPQVFPEQPRPERRHIPAQKYQELKNWQRVAERKKHRAFEPVALLGDSVADFIEEALSSDHAVSDVFAVAGDALRDNLSVQQAWEALETMKTQDAYRKGIRAAVRGLWAGTISRAEFEDMMASTIRRYFVEAWRRGLDEVGVSEADLTARDTEKLQIEIAQEILYAGSFGADIETGNKANGGKLADLYLRVEAWVDTYERIKYMAMAIAGRGKKLKWTRNPLKDSCTDCIRLDGRVYYGRIFEREGVFPRSRKLNCRGHQCGCSLSVTDEPVTKGPFPRLLGPKSHIHITADALASKGQGKPGLTVVARLADDPLLMDALMALQTATLSEDVQWCDPEDLHVTLVSAQLVTDSEFQNIIGRLPQTIDPIEIELGGLTKFDQATYEVWVLEISSPALFDLQKQIHEAFLASDIAVNGYSEPAEYKPHVTLAYVSKGIDMPDVPLGGGTTAVQEIHFTRSSYTPVHVIDGELAHAN